MSELWLATGPKVAALVFDADDPGGVADMCTQWSDVLTFSVVEALTAEEGLKLRPEALDQWHRQAWHRQATRQSLSTRRVIAADTSIATRAPARAETPIFGNANDFVGTWVQEDSEEDAILRARIRPLNSTFDELYVRIESGSRFDPIEWREESADYYNLPGEDPKVIFTHELVSSNGKTVAAYKEVELRLVSADRIAYEISTDFRDGREDYVTRGYLNRS